jgi:shikimate dehydrogenase
MLKLAVVGNPVFHSRSPEIFSFLKQQHSVNIHYNRISCEKISEAIDFADMMEMDGFNVTSPFKQLIIEHLEKLDYQAANLNAANTIVFKNKVKIGYNTDYFGILKTIWDSSISLNKKKVLILGAGAAARTAAFAIRNLNAIITIWDRFDEKSKKIANEFEINFSSTKEIIHTIAEYDFIISTIPPNSKILTELNFTKQQIIFDTIYHNSFFVENQKKFGFKVIIGEKWLINQASLSFEFFTNIKTEAKNIFNFLSNNKQQNSKSFIFSGFSGSGKTTLNKLCASNLGLNSFDLDEIIEEKTNLSINEIFKKYGENYFRELETQTLNEFAQNFPKSNFILSVGGGTLETQENVQLLKSMGSVVWIYSPLEIAFERIKTIRSRPLINNLEEAVNLFNSRKYSYFNNSEYIFINSSTIESAEERLVNEISRII